MHDDKALVLAKESLACFMLSAALAAPAGDYDQEWLLSVCQLMMGWDMLVDGETAFWLIPRTIYCLAVWMGFRAFIQSSVRCDGYRILAALCSVLAVLLGIGGLILLPEISR